MEVNVETKDPMVTHIANIGEKDPDYCELIQHISGKVKEIGNNSKYQDCIALIPFLSVTEVGDGKLIVVHDDKEILLPVDGRASLVETLHGTHMATETMVRSAKGKFTWPGLKKDLHAKYRGCSECLLFSKDKIDKSDQVPEALVNLYP